MKVFLLSPGVSIGEGTTDGRVEFIDRTAQWGELLRRGAPSRPPIKLLLLINVRGESRNQGSLPECGLPFLRHRST